MESESDHDALWKAYDWLFRCKTKAGAELMVKRVLSKTTPKEFARLARLARLFLNVRTRAPRATSGGLPGIEDAHDTKLYRFVELIDTTHDFFNMRNVAVHALEQYILDNGYELPKSVTPVKLQDERALIQHLSSKTHLTKT